VSGDEVVCGLLGTLPLLALLYGSQAVTWGPIARLRSTMDNVTVMFLGLSVIDILIVSTAAGIGEEILFRGVLQEGFDMLLGPVPGLFLASLLFGFGHAITPAYVVMATIAGFYFGGMYLARDHSLVAPVLVHSLYDFFAIYYYVSRLKQKSPEEIAASLPGLGAGASVPDDNLKS